MVLLRMLTILILLYALIVGIEDSSVQRATIMFVVYVVSLLVGRKGGGLLALIYAATLMLLINPYAFFGIGFQYSFVVVLFLILLTEKVNRVISRISLIKSTSSILSVIITAQIAAMLVGVLNSLSSNVAVSVLATLCGLHRQRSAAHYHNYSAASDRIS
jgi:predicted membrane metal-binding protein